MGLLVFAVVFGVACVLIRAAYPFPEVPNVKQKLVHFAGHRDEYDTLLLGSSRISYQIIPSMFDELTRAAGEPTKTFNAAVAGMRPPENTYFFDQLLAAKPSGLRWVFIEVMPMRIGMNEEHATLRAQYWHDLPRLSLLWRRALTLEPKKRSVRQTLKELSEPLSEFSEHLGLTMYELANVGRSTFLADRLLTLAPPTPISDYLGEHRDGWTETGRGERIMPAEQARLVKETADRLAKPAVRELSDPISQEALEAMIARAEKAGATPVLIIPPVTAKAMMVPRPERTERTILLDFNDPAKYPELYKVENRLDRNHLNTAGAKVFTKLVAEHWLAAVKERKGRP